MGSKSIVYSNIGFYRLVMQLLYGGKYYQRFRDITGLFGKEDKRILELCFGDICIAQYCKENGMEWTGYDINDSFIRHATGRGYNAKKGDILSGKDFPKADVCVMAGSLYHFHEDMAKVLSVMLGTAKRVIISEPVRNLSSGKGPVGYLARGAANSGKGKEAFRYNEQTFLAMLKEQSEEIGFRYNVKSKKRDILAELYHA